VFDLGCGVGRHVTYLGGRGFRLAGVDISPTGVQRTLTACHERGIAFEGHVSDMTLLPWSSETFEAALSTSTIHHGLRATIQQTLAEVWRILKPGGVFLVDFPVTDSADYALMRTAVVAGHIREVEPNTFVDERPDPDDWDGFLPHHYCDEAAVRDLLSDFTIERLWADSGPGRPGKWVVWARKEASGRDDS
jgi:SAM-dependent methyltransferase